MSYSLNCFLQNPLESILGMNSLMLDTALTPEQRSYCEGVQMGTELLVELFSDLYGTNIIDYLIKSFIT